MRRVRERVGGAVDTCRRLATSVDRLTGCPKLARGYSETSVGLNYYWSPVWDGWPIESKEIVKLVRAVDACRQMATSVDRPGGTRKTRFSTSLAGLELTAT